MYASAAPKPVMSEELKSSPIGSQLSLLIDKYWPLIAAWFKGMFVSPTSNADHPSTHATTAAQIQATPMGSQLSVLLGLLQTWLTALLQGGLGADALAYLVSALQWIEVNELPALSALGGVPAIMVSLVVKPLIDMLIAMVQKQIPTPNPSPKSTESK